MTVDILSNIIEQTLIEPDWDKLTLAEREYARGQGKAFVSLIPYVGGTAITIIRMMNSLGNLYVF